MRLLLALLSMGGFGCSPTGPETAPSAKSLIEEAVAQAKREKKRAMVFVGAHWCKPCAQMWKEAHEGYAAPLLAKNYVLVQIKGYPRAGDAPTNAGTEELLKKWAPNGTGGIPYYVVLDDSGKKLIDCLQRSESKNPINRAGFVGYDGDQFYEVYRRTARHTTSEELKKLRDYIDHA